MVICPEAFEKVCKAFAHTINAVYSYIFDMFGFKLLLSVSS